MKNELLKDMTILYVEDDKDVKEHIKVVLKDDVKELYIASNGEEGLELYSQKNPDIIITDINMPKMDGLSMLKQIRQIDHDIPVIVLTAYDDKKNILDAINTGSDGFLVKPIELDILYDKLIHIAKILNKKSKKKQELYRLAHFDNLTKLPNKLLFEVRLEKALSISIRNKKNLALFFIDIDNFKYINDTFGHEAGDRVLQYVAKNIKGIIRTEDTFCRRSGDEFLLLVEDVTSKDSLEHLAKKILHSVSEPVLYKNDSIVVTLSVGISHFPLDTNSPDEIMHQADMAMYRAKHNGKNRYSF